MQGYLKQRKGGHELMCQELRFSMVWQGVVGIRDLKDFDREIAPLEWPFLVFQERGGGEPNQHIA